MKVAPVVKIYPLLFILLMLPYLEPLGFKEEFMGDASVDSVYSAAKIIVFFGLLFFAFIRNRFSYMFFCQAGYAAILLLSTLLNGSSL